MEGLRTFWASRAPRERVLLAVFGALGAVSLYLMLIVQPFYTRADAAQRDYARAYEQSMMIARKASAIEAADRGQQATGSALDGLERAVQIGGLSAGNMIEEGASRARARFDEVSAAQFTSFLQTLTSTQGLSIVELMVERGRPGRVTATIAVQRLK